MLLMIVGVALWGGTRAEAASDITVVPGNGRVTITWSPAAPAKGATLSATATNGSSNVGCSTMTLSCSIVGLTNGVSYKVVVTVTDAANNVISSLTTTATPLTVPDPPILVSATAQDRQIAVSWQAPSSTGGSPITGYTASASAAGVATTCISTSTSCVVSGLNNGTAYTVSVFASNAAGRSASSTSLAVTPATVPDPPVGVAASLGPSDKLDVSWTPPLHDGGSSISGYVVRCSPNRGSSWTTEPAASSTRLVVSNVSNTQRYVCEVAAVNAAGRGAYSAPSAASSPAPVSRNRSSAVATRDHPVAGAFGVIVVTLVDAAGRPLAGQRVTLRASKPGQHFVAVSDANGRARFDVVGTVAGVVRYWAYDATVLLGSTSVTFSAATVTTTAPTTTSTTTTTSTPVTTSTTVTTTTIVRHLNGAAHIRFSAVAGLQVGSYRITVRGHGFRPGSTFTISVHSAPVTIGVVTVDPGGSFRTVVQLPPRLPVGVHDLAVTSGSYVLSDPFTVVSGHVVGAIGSIPAGALARYTVLNPANDRNGVLEATAGVLVVLAAVASALGGARSGRSGGRVAGLEDVELERKLDDELREEGNDRVGTRRLDRFSRLSPRRLAALSPVVGRVVSDGDYLRAVFGNGWLLACVASVGLGIDAARTTGWYAVAPSLGLFLAILGLGVFDATLGYLAGASFLVAVTAAGHLSSAGARVAFGLILVWFAVPLAAGALATLRRAPSRDLDGLFLRASDVALGGLFGAWVAYKMTAALPELAGVSLPIGREASVVAWAALGFVAARIVVESIVAVRRRRRLAVVTHQGELESGNAQMAISLVFQLGLFLFVSVGALGASSTLYLGAAVFFAPLVAGLFVDKIPKSRLLTRFEPRGLVKWSVVIVATLGLTKLLEHSGLTTRSAESLGFVLLPLPILVMWTWELFTESEDATASTPHAFGAPLAIIDVSSDASRWRWRVLGVLVLVASVVVVVNQGLAR